MATFTFDENVVSDLYKDSYGFRPSEYFYTAWDAKSDEEKQSTWDDLIKSMNDRADFEADLEKRAIEDFEKLITKTIDLGADDRSTACRWIMDGSEANGDWEYLCFLHGIPYGFFKNIIVDTRMD